MLMLLTSFAFAQEPVQRNNIPKETVSCHVSSHGPDKPPPSDGYEFKDKKGGNAKAKIGFLLILSSSIPALSARKLDVNSPEQIKKKNKAVGMAVVGLGLIVWERLQN